MGGISVTGTAGRPWRGIFPGLIVIAVMAAALQGCGRGSEAGSGASGGSGRPGGPGGARVAAVETAPVEVGVIARALTVSGVIEPLRTVGVNSQLAGAVVAVEVEEGSRVRAGDVLARLDDRELQAQLEAAETSFQVAESAFRRAEQLLDQKVVTLAEHDRDRAAYVAAKTHLDQIRTRLEYATVTAPMAGVVTGKRIEAGDVVATQSRLFTLADLSTLVVPVQVSELDVVDLRVGGPVEITMDAFPGRPLAGRIRRIFPAGDPVTRLVPVEVALQGEALRLARPGFLARATFALGVHEDVLLIPASALVGGQRSQAVFVVEDGRATRRTVAPGLASQGRVEILSGLSAGERVVTVGNNTLQDGAQVRVVGAEGAGAGAGDGTREADGTARGGESAAGGRGGR